MSSIYKHSRILLAAIIIMVLSITLVACSNNNINTGDALIDYPKSDMSGYSGLEGYDKELRFVDVTMSDVKYLMKNKGTFVLYAGYSNCPWCNEIISHLNDVALEENMMIGYLDTRRDPSWQSNMDIEGYDVFVELFGDYLDEDEGGQLHLYVPDTYFVKDGQVVARHEGVTPSLDSPGDEWSDAMIEEVETSLKEAFDKLK